MRIKGIKEDLGEAYEKKFDEYIKEAKRIGENPKFHYKLMSDEIANHSTYDFLLQPLIDNLFKNGYYNDRLKCLLDELKKCFINSCFRSFVNQCSVVLLDILYQFHINNCEKYNLIFCTYRKKAIRSESEYKVAFSKLLGHNKGLSLGLLKEHINQSIKSLKYKTKRKSLAKLVKNIQLINDIRNNFTSHLEFITKSKQMFLEIDRLNKIVEKIPNRIIFPYIRDLKKKILNDESLIEDSIRINDGLEDYVFFGFEKDLEKFFSSVTFYLTYEVLKIILKSFCYK